MMVSDKVLKDYLDKVSRLLTNWHLLFLSCVESGDYKDFPEYKEIPNSQIVADLKDCFAVEEVGDTLVITDVGRELLKIWEKQTWPDGDCSKCPVCDVICNE